MQAALKVQGDFKNIKKTLKGNYELAAKNLKWKDALASAVEGNGKLDLATNEIQIDKINIFERRIAVSMVRA